MGDGNNKVTTVKIFNQTYSVRGDDCDRIEKLADFVDRRMLEVSKHTPTVDSVKIAILAALNIADEVFVLQDRLERLEREVGERSERMIAALEPFVEA